MDETGSTSAVVVNVPSTSSIATMDATATALASLIAPMTDCVLVKIRHSFRNQFVVDIRDAGSNPITVAGMFFFEDFDGLHIGIVNIPALKSSLIISTGVGAGVLIDTSDDAVNEFITYAVSNDLCTPMGDFFFRIKTAYRQSRV
jgi:hypothetical protein